MLQHARYRRLQAKRPPPGGKRVDEPRLSDELRNAESIARSGCEQDKSQATSTFVGS
jgi:hypothetical protein